MAGRRAPARPPRPRSRHFLRSRSLAAAIVAGADLDASELVVDIGAGTGRLTAELARVARRVVAIELDPQLAAGLRGRWSNVSVVEGDARTVALPDEPFRVVANIPFAHTSDLLHRLLDDPRLPLLRADLIVEWGVAVKRGLPARAPSAASFGARSTSSASSASCLRPTSIRLLRATPGCSSPLAACGR